MFQRSCKKFCFLLAIIISLVPKEDYFVLIPLPPYAPELNAMEQDWEWITNHYLSFCPALFMILGEITLFLVLYTQDPPGTVQECSVTAAKLSLNYY